MLTSMINWIVYSLLGLEKGSSAGAALHFFLYDSVKILCLLFVMIWIMGILRTFIPPDRIRAALSRRSLSAHFAAAVFGSLTPFCSCSSIPIFFSTLRAGVPLGVAFSFLITSPIINEYLVVLMLGFFGIKITVLYVISGVVVGVTTGLILGRLRLKRYIEEDMSFSGMKQTPQKFASLRDRVLYGRGEAVDIVKKLWGWILFGVGLGALIHNYIPQETIQGVINRTGPFSVPLAVLLGVPMYGSCAAIVPIAVVLFKKGIPLGTALAFMMATSALSLPEAVLLRRAMKLPLVLTFFAIAALAIVLTGYLFNFIQGLLI